MKFQTTLNAGTGIKWSTVQLKVAIGAEPLDRRTVPHVLRLCGPIDQLDVSNSNPPGAVDPTTPVGENLCRAAAQVDPYEQSPFTETSAYSGNIERAVIWNNSHGADFFYTSGNAGNGSKLQPDGILLGAGTQIISPANEPESAQNPSTPTPVGRFNITELGYKADKIGKDDNFRGLTIFNNVRYYSKGSGSKWRQPRLLSRHNRHGVSE